MSDPFDPPRHSSFVDAETRADLDKEIAEANQDPPLSPAEIAAWARRWCEVHDRHMQAAIDAGIIEPGKADLDLRAMRQTAETFERLVILTGGRHFATGVDGKVNLPVEHVRRSVANELAEQFAPLMRMTEKWDGYRMRFYAASITVVLPEKP
jgi:hypothetical protein